MTPAILRVLVVAQLLSGVPIHVLADAIPDAVPPDFAADLLIRIADSDAGRREPAEWRRQLYERAFTLADGAQQRLPRLLRPKRPPPDVIDPRGTFIGLNALSLKVRAFSGLLELNPERAIELARTVEVDVPVRSCSDAFALDPAGVFDMARHDPDALEKQVFAVRSSTQLGPAFEAILAAGDAASPAQDLAIILASTMREIADDDLAFTNSVDRTWEAIRHVIEARTDDSFAAFVLDAFRTYLVRHLSGERCSRESEASLVDELNRSLETHDLPRVSDRERTPSAVLPSASASSPALWQTAASQRLRMQLRDLRTHRQSGRPADDRRPTEWDDALAAFYASFASWHAADEPSNDVYLLERDALLEALVEMLPIGADRNCAIQQTVDFLQANGRSLFNNDVYASRIRALIDHSRNSPDAWEAVLSALRNSEDPIMRFYADVEGLASPQR